MVGRQAAACGAPSRCCGALCAGREGAPQAGSASFGRAERALSPPASPVESPPVGGLAATAAALTSHIELLEAGAGGVVTQAGGLAEPTDGFFG